MSINKNWIFRELQQATADLTISKRSDLFETIGEGSVDDLAIDFNNFLHAAKPYLKLSDRSGLELLIAIDEKLNRISGGENVELWTVDAFINHDVWNEIRDNATIAIKHFGWSNRCANLPTAASET